jgi:FtsH-binding integral membrane protein
MVIGAVAGALAMGAWLLGRVRMQQETLTPKSAILWIAGCAGYFISSLAMPYAKLRWVARALFALAGVAGAAALIASYH